MANWNDEELHPPRHPASDKDIPPVIYFNVGWMKAYRGPTADERTQGAHAYLKQHRYGAESFNFLEVDGRVGGYRPGHRQGIRIERLGAGSRDERVDGILAVWMAKEPVSGSTRIVGWYKNATVYRQSRYPRSHGHSINGEEVWISVEAAGSDVKLLPMEARQFEVPSHHRMKGGFGQSPVWYGAPDVNRRVLRFIKEIELGSSVAPRPKGSGKSVKPPKNFDPELRRKVERAAVNHAIDFYRSPEGGSGKVVSVEVEAVGWDLTVEKPDGSVLLIEVKGLQGDRLVCELTPNEFARMQEAAHRDRYRVYVVCNALTQPLSSVFAHVADGRWETLDGRKLGIQPKIAAVLSCPPAGIKIEKR